MLATRYARAYRTTADGKMIFLGAGACISDRGNPCWARGEACGSQAGRREKKERTSAVPYTDAPRP
eukprot:11006070-Lingulodinium_polyedra.AAC.1